MEAARLRFLSADRDLVMNLVAFTGSVTLRGPTRFQPFMQSLASTLLDKVAHTVTAVVSACQDALFKVMPPEALEFAVLSTSIKGRSVSDASCGIFATNDDAEMFVGLRARIMVDLVSAIAGHAKNHQVLATVVAQPMLLEVAMSGLQGADCTVPASKWHLLWEEILSAGPKASPPDLTAIAQTTARKLNDEVEDEVAEMNATASLNASDQQEVRDHSTYHPTPRPTSKHVFQHTYDNMWGWGGWGDMMGGCVGLSGDFVGQLQQQAFLTNTLTS